MLTLPKTVCTLLITAVASFIQLAQAARFDDEAHVKKGIDPRSELEQVRRGYEIVPAGVYLNFNEKNRILVGLGSYVVNTSGCLDCHTHPAYFENGEPSKGFPELINFPQYMTGGRHFGPITSANLTPDSAGKPAGLTLGEFIQTLRTGHNPHDPPGQILQVMPWSIYGKKTDRDLTAIYEFLRALPSLPDNPNPGP